MPRSAAAGSASDSGARAARPATSSSRTRAWRASWAAARTCPGRSCSPTWTTTGRCAPSARSDVNDYLREITGQDFTAKDFRTWAGTVLAAWALKEFERGRLGGAGQAQRGAGRRAGGRVARQHAGRVAPVVRPPGGDRRLPGWGRGAGRAPDGGQEAARATSVASRRRRPPCWRCCANVCATRSERGPRPRRADAGRAGSPRSPASGRRPCAGAAARAAAIAQAERARGQGRNARNGPADRRRSSPGTAPPPDRGAPWSK